MAAEVLEKTCKKAGYNISVETQGALGSENHLEENVIGEADVAVIIADIDEELNDLVIHALSVAPSPIF